MWSEDLDKKAQEAAGNQTPAYDEKSWGKMESLLDTHLPVEKKKRRFAIWFILPILAGLAVYFIIHENSAKKEIVVASDTRQNNPASVDQPTTTLPEHNDAAPQTQPKSESFTAAQNSPIANDELSNKSNGLPVSITNSSNTVVIPAPANQESLPNNQVKARTPKGKTSGQQPMNIPVYESLGKQPVFAVPVELTPTPKVVSLAPNKPSSDKQDIAADVITDKTAPGFVATSIVKTDSAQTTQPASATKKPKKGQDKGLSVLLSAGPDLSGIGMASAGTVRMQYGLGLSYAFSKNWSLRTGFYTGRKVYSAQPSEYHADSYFWMYYPNLQKVDANCLVYEIPLSVVYTFPAAKKHSWFVSTGVSSYLMKKEEYDYYSKNAWGQTEVKSRTINNENKHLFSIINISGGYKYNFSKHLSLMTEPYMKIPTNGVGAGKVKLNSAGVMFTLGIKLK